MNVNTNNIKLVEVHCDIAGRKRGASLGIEALKQSSEDLDSQYFKNFLGEAIEDESQALLKQSAFKCAKYIDKIAPIIERLCERIKVLRKQNLFPIVLAGDHSSCAGTMHGLKMAHPDDQIGVVYIDAHADFHSPYTSPSGNMHGMPLAIACALDNEEKGINDPSSRELVFWERLKTLSGAQAAIDPKNVIFCALRDYEEAEAHLIEKHHITTFSTQEITYLGIESTVKKIFDQLSHCKHIYVSFDVDSVDPLYMPGTGTPAENGLSYEQALQLNLELIKNERVCCWEIAEINPLYNKTKKEAQRAFIVLDEVTKMLIRHY